MQTGGTKVGSVTHLRMLTEHDASCIISMCLRVNIDLYDLTDLLAYHNKWQQRYLGIANL